MDPKQQAQPKRPAGEEDQLSSKRAALDNNPEALGEPTGSSAMPTAVPINTIAQAPIISMRALISAKIVGAIIGKSGQTIRNFREESDSKINISDAVPGATERILTVTGTSAAVAKAFFLVSTRLEEDNQTALSANTAAPPAAVAAAAAAAAAGANVIRLLVAHSQVGPILGKGGVRHKELQEQSGARITVSEEPLPQSTERAVSIIGSPAAVQKVAFEIAQRLLESPDKGQTIPYRPMGRNNSNSNSAQNGLLSVIPSAPSISYNQHHFVPNMYAPLNNIRTLQQMNINQGIASQQLYIPADMVGCIIGKGGSKIQEIRQRSGAQQVKIEDAVPGSSERLVTIVGTPEANHAALYMLYHRLQTERAGQ